MRKKKNLTSITLKNHGPVFIYPPPLRALHQKYVDPLPAPIIISDMIGCSCLVDWEYKESVLLLSLEACSTFPLVGLSHLAIFHTDTI
jgi:hypothetical protein